MAVGGRLVVLDNRHGRRTSDTSEGGLPGLPSGLHNAHESPPKSMLSHKGVTGASQDTEDYHWSRWQAARSHQLRASSKHTAITEGASANSAPAKGTVRWMDSHQAQAEGGLATEDCSADSQAGSVSPQKRLSVGSASLGVRTRRMLHARSHTHNWSRKYRESRLGLRSLEFLVIDPRNSFQRRWDVLTILLVFSIVLRVPYEVVFLTERIDNMFWVNRLVDVIFLVDIVLNFFLAYFDKAEGMWMFNPKKLRARYVAGWFVVDVVALMPLHWVVPLLGKERKRQFVVGGVDILKLSQACKLLRVLRVPRILKRLETAYNLNFIQMELIKFFLKTCILSHWAACLFGAVDSFEPGDATWLSSYLCLDDTWSASCQREHFMPYTRYLAGLYWTVATLTTIGFGDVVAITDNERVVSVIVMLFGAFQYGYIIGMLANLLATRDEAKNRYIQMMTELNLFMAETKIPVHIQKKLREYFKFRMSAPNLKAYHSILDAMSPWLRREVSVFHDGKWIKQVELLKDTPEQFLVEVALNITQQTYPPFETIYEKGDRVEQMRIIKKGLVDCGGTICRKFQILAEECLYKEWIQETHVMTMTFVEMWSVECKKLLQIIAQFPEVRRIIRFNAIRRIFRQEIFAYSLACRMMIQKQMRGLDDDVLYNTNCFFSLLTGQAVSYRAIFYFKKLMVLHGLSVGHQIIIIESVNRIKRCWLRTLYLRSLKRENQMRAATGGRPVTKQVPEKRIQDIKLNMLIETMRQQSSQIAELQQMLVSKMHTSAGASPEPSQGRSQNKKCLICMERDQEDAFQHQNSMQSAVVIQSFTF